MNRTKNITLHTSVKINKKCSYTKHMVAFKSKKIQDNAKKLE